MDSKKLSEEEKRLDRFTNALQKMSLISLQYQQGKLKHMPYCEQMDALMDASGWSRSDFQQEIERRRKKLGQR